MHPYTIPTDGSSTTGHYFAGIGSNVRIINLFNPQDIALNGWEFDQLTKPNFAQGETWNYSNSYLDAVVEYFRNCIDICDSPPSEPIEVTSSFRRGNTAVPFNQDAAFEIMAHVIPARTFTLGQVEVAVGNEIGGNQPMAGFTNSNQDHSAPYHGFYSERSLENSSQQRAAYWNILLDQSIYPVDKSGLTKLANGTGL